MTLYGVIMAGGSGTRFWPYSRTNRPKQLLKLFSGKSMISETVERLSPIIPTGNIFVSTNEFLGGLIRQELPGVNYVIEPLAKNTAACIGLSAISIMEKDPEGIMFIETTDHVYDDVEKYLDIIRKAAITARKGKVVLIGIKPAFPHTGYGYIHAGEAFDEGIPDSYFIESFKEKPDYKTAKEFVEAGTYLWNSGMFIAKCSAMLEEMRLHMPALYQGLMRIRASGFDKDTTLEVFNGLESISIDYGVMEKCKNKVMLKADIGWDDIGDFLAIERYYPKDEKKNVALCSYKGNAARCILMSQTRKITANNVDELVIVDTPDATLICSKEKVQSIKKVLEKIKEADLSAYLDDYVSSSSNSIISLDSDECSVESDGLMVLMDVARLEIRRNSEELAIEGIEQEVEIENN